MVLGGAGRDEERLGDLFVGWPLATSASTSRSRAVNPAAAAGCSTSGAARGARRLVSQRLGDGLLQGQRRSRRPGRGKRRRPQGCPAPPPGRARGPGAPTARTAAPSRSRSAAAAPCRRAARSAWPRAAATPATPSSASATKSRSPRSRGRLQALPVAPERPRRGRRGRAPRRRGSAGSRSAPRCSPAPAAAAPPPPGTGPRRPGRRRRGRPAPGARRPWLTCMGPATNVGSSSWKSASASSIVAAASS